MDFQKPTSKPFFEPEFPFCVIRNSISIQKLKNITFDDNSLYKDLEKKEFKSTCDMPKLEDLYYLLEDKNEIDYKEEYVKLLSLLRPISIGQASTIWNGYTDITIDTRLTIFNTKNMQEFQTQYKRAQYYNIMSYAWEILSKNKDERDE